MIWTWWRDSKGRAEPFTPALHAPKLPRSAGIPDSLTTWTAARRVAFARFASLRSFDDSGRGLRPRPGLKIIPAGFIFCFFREGVVCIFARSPRPESSTDRKEAKRAKATRLAAVDVASESGIPADRGSFGA